MIGTLRVYKIQMQCKIYKKNKLLERKFLKYTWKMSIKYLKKYKCDECGKNFTHNIGLKGHIILQLFMKEKIQL